MGIDIPLISIAMATYNGEKYLKAQLDSIYAQTYKNIEVIVCDDCSSDKTVEILEDYSKKFGLKYFVNETNLGFVKNFEKAVNLCRGDYIALSDQDDIWLPHKLSTLIENIGDNILACSDAKLIDEKNNIISESFFQYSNKPINEELTFEKLAICNYVTGCTVLMKNKILQNAHPIPLNISYHDWWYGLIASVFGGIYLHNESLILYRQHQDNHTGAYHYAASSLLSKIFSQFTKVHFQKRVEDGKKYVARLQAFRSYEHFSLLQYKFLDELIYYYQSWAHIGLDFKAFGIALKYRKELFYRTPRIFRCLAILRTLFM
ncbi:MAG: glycosyltransferase family 2 protein [Sulfurovum sp.]|nr:glycosyltransferase family 2 protein [Sulfurovum sp.]